MSEDVEEVVAPVIGEHGRPGPKDPKGSARSAYNRRKALLADAMEQMERAIVRLQAQPGTVYKRAEMDSILEAIGSFRQTTGLKTLDLPPPTQEEMDRFMDWLQNAPPYEPMSKEELAVLLASLEGLPKEADDDADDGLTGG